MKNRRREHPPNYAAVLAAGFGIVPEAEDPSMWRQSIAKKDLNKVVNTRVVRLSVRKTAVLGHVPR